VVIVLNERRRRYFSGKLSVRSMAHWLPSKMPNLCGVTSNRTISIALYSVSFFRFEMLLRPFSITLRLRMSVTTKDDRRGPKIAEAA
jgi:hypothetical protein